MAFDLKAFGTDLGLTAEELGQIETVLNKPERLAVLEKNQLRQTDYSKNMDALKKAQTDLAVANDRLTNEMAEWANLTAAEKAAATKLREDLDASQQTVLKLQQRVTKIATDAGLDAAKALEGIDQPPPKKEEPPVPPIDTSKFIDVDRFGAVQSYMFDLLAELPMIAQEHFDLTGERLDTRVIRAEIAERAQKKGANLDPRAIWEEKFDIPAKRTAQSQAARDAEIKAAEERGAARARSEAALPIPPQNGQHSPLLRANGENYQSKLQRPQPESAVAAAASAFASGKYRQQPATRSA